MEAEHSGLQHMTEAVLMGREVASFAVQGCGAVRVVRHVAPSAVPLASTGGGPPMLLIEYR